MKRTALFAGAIALVVVSLSLASYRGQPASSPPPPPIPGDPLPASREVEIQGPEKPVSPPLATPPDAGVVPAPPSTSGSTRPPNWANPRSGTATAPSGKPAGLVEELVTILNETQSKETFTVTLAVLKKLGKEAKPAVPAILRTADRLAMFKGALEGETKGKEARTEVLDAIDAILESRTESSGFSSPPLPVSSSIMNQSFAR